MRTMHKSFEDRTVIPVDVINALEQGLKNLRKLNGRLRSPYPKSRFWFPTDVEIMNKNAETLVNDFAAIERCQVMIQRFKLTSEALSTMSRSVEAEMHRMVRKTRPGVLARGIRIISDEILALILQNIYNDWGTDMDPKDKPEYMGRVCKRFKHVIDSRPFFKAFLSSSTSRAEISRRVRQLGESVGLRLCFNDREPNFGILVEQVVPLALRWEEVNFHVTSANEADVEADVESAYAKLNALFLPRLKRFTFWRSEPLKPRTAGIIYSSWYAPNLVDVDCTNVVPHSLPFKPTIKSFALVEEYSSGVLDKDYFGRLSGVLGALSSLTSLYLSFNNLTFDAMAAKGVKGVEIPNLRELDVSFDFPSPGEGLEVDQHESESELRESGKAIFKFVALLETPLLRRVTVTSKNGDYWSSQTARFIENLSNARRTSGRSSLRTFEFKGDNSHDVRMRIKVSTLLTIVDNPKIEGSVLLHNLELDEDDFSDDEYASTIIYAALKLRKLHLTECSLPGSTLQKLLNLFIKSDHFPDFEEIVLTRCYGYTMESPALRGMYVTEFVRFEH